METVQQNGGFTIFRLNSIIYLFILYGIIKHILHMKIIILFLNLELSEPPPESGRRRNLKNLSRGLHPPQSGLN